MFSLNIWLNRACLLPEAPLWLEIGIWITWLQWPSHWENECSFRRLASFQASSAAECGDRPWWLLLSADRLVTVDSSTMARRKVGFWKLELYETLFTVIRCLQELVLRRLLAFVVVLFGERMFMRLTVPRFPRTHEIQIKIINLFDNWLMDLRVKCIKSQSVGEVFFSGQSNFRFILIVETVNATRYDFFPMMRSKLIWVLKKRTKYLWELMWSARSLTSFSKF
jgi:hypothetical protein